MYDQNGNELQLGRESFIYNTQNLTFTLSEKVSSMISVTTNGLVEYGDDNYTIIGKDTIELTGEPVYGSKIDFVYLY